MTIALRQLQQVVKGSGGEISDDRHLAAYLVNMHTGRAVLGVLAELAQLGLESQHVKLLGSSTIEIQWEGVTK